MKEILVADQTCELLLDPYNGKVHQTGRYFGDRLCFHSFFFKKITLKCYKVQWFLPPNQSLECRPIVDFCRAIYTCNQGYQIIGISRLPKVDHHIVHHYDHHHDHHHHHSQDHHDQIMMITTTVNLLVIIIAATHRPRGAGVPSNRDLVKPRALLQEKRSLS